MKVLDGEKLKEWREINGVAQWELACELDITAGFLSTIESGKRGVSIETLKKISRRTGLSADELISKGSE